MSLCAWIGILMSLVVQAAPLSRDGALEIRQNENIHITTGEPARDRTLFTVVSIFCTAVLAFLLGSRIHRLKRSIRSRRNLMSILLLAIYVVVICYIIVSAALVSGQGLYTYELCDAGTWVCLMFYISIKGIVYAFLAERVHVVRAPFVRRSKDKVYLTCVVPVILLYLAVSVNSYVYRVTAMHKSDGRCHFGVGRVASIPVLSANLLSNIALTSVFFYLLRPVVKFHSMATVSAVFTRKSKDTGTVAQPTENVSAVQKNIQTLLWKSIVGAILIELPVAANMIQLIVTRGQELGMICLTVCMFDVFWDTLVIHWLTFGSSAAAEKELLRSTEASSRQGLTRQQESCLSRSDSRKEKREPVIVKAPEIAYLQQPDLEISICTNSTGIAPASVLK